MQNMIFQGRTSSSQASSLRLALACLLLLLQLAFSAHAFADADHSSIDDCRVCQQAERQDHAIPPGSTVVVLAPQSDRPAPRPRQGALPSGPREFRNKAPPFT